MPSPNDLIRKGPKILPKELFVKIHKGIQGIQGEKGDKGEPGYDGYIPIKGIDYFDGIDGKDGVDGKDGAPGKDGKNGRNGKDGLDGEPGKNGKDGKDGTDGQVPDKNDIIEDVIKELKNPKSKRRLKTKDIEGLPINFADQRWHGGGLSTVAHDSSIIGDGSPTSPLSVASATDKDLRLETAFAALDNYTEFSYNLGNLIQINIWSDITKTTKLFQKDFTYTGSDLTQLVTTRISDGATLTKTFTYLAGNLVSIQAST